VSICAGAFHPLYLYPQLHLYLNLYLSIYRSLSPRARVFCFLSVRVHASRTAIGHILLAIGHILLAIGLILLAIGHILLMSC